MVSSFPKLHIILRNGACSSWIRAADRFGDDLYYSALVRYFHIDARMSSDAP